MGIARAAALHPVCVRLGRKKGAGSLRYDFSHQDLVRGAQEKGLLRHSQYLLGCGLVAPHRVVNRSVEEPNDEQLKIQDAVFSPDGRWIAYTRHDESGRPEIWMASFPDPTRSRQQITTGGGVGARWAASGVELFFMQGRTLMAQPVTLGPTFETRGPPIELFEVPNIAINDASPDYDVMPDGESFLVLTDDPESVPRQIHVIQGWAQELLQRDPP